MMASVLVVIALTSCETKQESGALIGGTTGALIGSQFGRGPGKLLGLGLGGIIGAIAGSAIGNNLDAKDQEKMAASTHKSLENSKTGQVSTWRNPDSGNTGTVVPTRSYKSISGDYCREYTHTVTVAGRTQEAYGTACRKPDGSWQIVS